MPPTAVAASAEPAAADDASGSGRSGGSRGGGSSNSYIGDASALVPLSATSDEWQDCLRFYGIQADVDGGLPGQQVLWAPGRAAKREKLYLASRGAAELVSERWAAAASTPRGAKALKGRLHSVGVKAFERLKLTNVRSKASYTCGWRPCQQALPYLLPVLTRRVLTTSDEEFFAAVLRERGVRKDSLGRLDGLETCCDADGQVASGGAVLSLVTRERKHGEGGQASKASRGRAEVLASVVSVLSPGGLSVWAPKEEVNGLLGLLAC